MDTFKIGDVVARKSYNLDILFKIIGINKNIVDLAGLTVRIVADSPMSDLVHITETEAKDRMKKIDDSRRKRMDRCYYNINKKFNIRDTIVDNPNIYVKEKIFKKPGVILHIDGDAEYTEKCRENYKRMGLTAYVYNISEEEQYKQVYSLLQKIRPNILILTGHDSFLRKRNDMYNINNYKNSKYFIQGVLEARRYEHNLDNLVIFAGACQSYYEAIISAGANFASAPKRVLIDMLDPLIVAESIAYTPVDKFIPLASIISNTREGIDGIGGVQTRGQYREGMPGM
ncbi:MAG: sporulation peptidase YabG [Clostridia bacterium]|nr:sporulation peptidase YabG [Clostridia bacterium]MDD4386303.1 sporulation peptidase YabG [Clostridia bacterium]